MQTLTEQEQQQEQQYIDDLIQAEFDRLVAHDFDAWLDKLDQEQEIL